MKRLLLLVSCFVCAGAFAQDADKAIESVKEKLALDDRTSVFDVKAVPTNGPTVLTGETSVPQAKEELLGMLKEQGIETIDAITLLPDKKALDGKIYGVIRIPVGTLRYGPSYASEQATQLLMGTPVRILKKEGWYLVQTPEDYVSWVSSSSVEPMTRQQFNEYLSHKKLIFLSDEGWIYEKPDASSARIASVVVGALLLDKGSKGKYAHVGLPDGRKGYVLKKDVTDFDQWRKETRPTAGNVLKNAYRFMGTPYLWAGTSADMLDCSGFTKTVYMINGVVLARDASQQYLTGQSVDISQGYDKLQPGDLVFFGSRNADGTPKRVWHVGIYVGDGRFIHEAGDVHVNSFNPEHPEYSQSYVDILVHASRIIGNEDKGLGITSYENNPYFAQQ